MLSYIFIFIISLSFTFGQVNNVNITIESRNIKTNQNQYLEQLKQVIGLRSYGQKDPLAEFRREAFQLFEDLLFKIKTETIKFLINTNIVIQDKKEEKQTSNFIKKRKISRNEPCSCGSGKKYKHCHGKVA